MVNERLLSISRFSCESVESLQPFLTKVVLVGLRGRQSILNVDVVHIVYYSLKDRILKINMQTHQFKIDSVPFVPSPEPVQENHSKEPTALDRQILLMKAQF